MTEVFWHELAEGDIHARDHLQFELKSEFTLDPTSVHNTYRQEFFIFVPNTLQINDQTYSKTQFYFDQTNLIRFKTPELSFDELLSKNNTTSPLTKLRSLGKQQTHSFDVQKIEEELKLFGNIFRVTLREAIRCIVEHLKYPSSEAFELVPASIADLCTKVNNVIEVFNEIKYQLAMEYPEKNIELCFEYIDEFMSNKITLYSTALLHQLRESDPMRFKESEKTLCELIVKEELKEKFYRIHPNKKSERYDMTESILYRAGLLNIYVLEALMLQSQRFSFEQKHGDILGALAAGIAMFIYTVLLVWKIPSFVINSFPFIIFAVFFYVLKDRIKEGLKRVFFKKAPKWFPDYSTNIFNPSGYRMGVLTENFSFITADQLPQELLKTRRTHFNQELQELSRHETIIQYKREVTVKRSLDPSKTRRKGITIIFRLNIEKFLYKASNPFEPTLVLDSYTQELHEKLLPKIYHLNMIIKNTTTLSNKSQTIEIKTFRVVVDKVGITRVEQL